VGSYPLLSLAPTPVEVELGCDNTLDQRQKIFNHRSTIRANCEIAKIVLLPHSIRVKYTFGSNKTPTVFIYGILFKYYNQNLLICFKNNDIHTPDLL
jgi:hypothetical protein